MKKLIIFFIMSIVIANMVMAGPLFSIDKQNGGCVSCIAGILGGPRLGYMVNDKKSNVDLLDALNFILPIITYYDMFVGFQNEGCWGCLVGAPGYTTAKSLEKYKARTKEKFACLVIPAWMMYWEMFNGKKWTEVVKEENLKK